MFLKFKRKEKVLKKPIEYLPTYVSSTKHSLSCIYEQKPPDWVFVEADMVSKVSQDHYKVSFIWVHGSSKELSSLITKILERA